jgi:hypothetical protein
MYRIQTLSGDQWSVADESDLVVFVGTLAQCQDWLDFQDHARSRPIALKARLRQLWERLRRKPAEAPHQPPENAGRETVPPV